MPITKSLTRPLTHRLTRAITQAGAGGGAWTPAQWFLASEQGIWLDPSDITRYMGELGPELVTNGTFDTNNNGWTLVNGSFTVTAGVITVTNVATRAVNKQALATIVGATYQVIATGIGGTGVPTIRVMGGSDNFAAAVILGSTSGTYTFVATSTTTWLYIAEGIATNGLTVTTDSISVKQLTSISTATLFQDSAGTTPVTAVEQPVGLMLDKRLGLVPGPELVTNGTFDTDASGWTAFNAASLSSVAGKLRITSTGAADAGVQQTVSGLTIGTLYELSYYCDPGTMGDCYVDPTPAVVHTVAGTYRGFFVATGTAKTLTFRTAGAAANGTYIEFDNISFRAVPGNHASQPTTAQKPVLSARKNLLTYTEQFDNAAWTKGANAAVTANSVASPNGTTTADTYTSSGADDSLYATLSGLIAGEQLATIIRVKQGTGRWLKVQCYDGANGYRVWVDTQTSTIGTSNTFGAGATLTSAAVVALADGWMQVTLVGTAPTTSRFVQLNSVTADASVTHANGSFYVWGAHTERGATVAAYQRVNTATDYDTVGFPHYLKFDGVDDNLATSNIDFTATDKMTVMAGVASTDTVGYSVIAEIGVADWSVVNGSFSLGDTSQFIFGSRGTLNTSVAQGHTIVPGVANVVTGLGDIAADGMILRVNGAQVGANAADQGTGNYGNHVLHIGRRPNATGIFIGNINQLIIRGAATADLTPGETYVAGKTGITL